MTAKYIKKIKPTRPKHELTEEDKALVVEYLPLVRYIVNQFSTENLPSIDRDDLEQCGVIGLIDAVGRHNPIKGSLKNLAYRRIKGEIIEEIRRASCYRRSKKARAFSVVSLEESVVEDQFTLIDILECKAPSPLEQILQKEIEEAIHRALDELTPQNKDIIDRHFFKDLTVTAIGRELGVTGSAIHQRRASSLKSLKKSLKEEIN